MRRTTEAERTRQRALRDRLDMMGEANAVLHAERMDTDRRYYGEAAGHETCVQDRRTGSVRFANRYVGVAWAFQHLAKRFIEPSVTSSTPSAPASRTATSMR